MFQDKGLTGIRRVSTNEETLGKNPYLERRATRWNLKDTEKGYHESKNKTNT